MSRGNPHCSVHKAPSVKNLELPPLARDTWAEHLLPMKRPVCSWSELVLWAVLPIVEESFTVFHPAPLLLNSGVGTQLTGCRREAEQGSPLVWKLQDQPSWISWRPEPVSQISISTGRRANNALSSPLQHCRPKTQLLPDKTCPLLSRAKCITLNATRINPYPHVPSAPLWKRSIESMTYHLIYI